MDDCGIWLAENLDAFTPLSGQIQAVAAGFRPDLLDLDPALALTGEKFVLLLDELTRFEAFLNLEDTPELDAGAFRRLAGQRLTGAASGAPPQPLQAFHCLLACLFCKTMRLH